HVGKSGAIFDPIKLHWMGTQYFAKFSLDDLTRALLPFLADAQYITREEARVKFDWLKAVVDTVRTNLGCFSDIVKETQYFFSDELHFDPSHTEEIQKLKPLMEIFMK